MKLNNTYNELTQLMKDYMDSEYVSDKKDLDFYFCEPKNTESWFKIVKTQDGVILSNHLGSERLWEINEEHHNLEEDRSYRPPAHYGIEILQNKNSITFYYDYEPTDSQYDLSQPDFNIERLHLILNPPKKLFI